MLSQGSVDKMMGALPRYHPLMSQTLQCPKLAMCYLAKDCMARRTLSFGSKQLTYTKSPDRSSEDQAGDLPPSPKVKRMVWVMRIQLSKMGMSVLNTPLAITGTLCLWLDPGRQPQTVEPDRLRVSETIRL